MFLVFFCILSLPAQQVRGSEGKGKNRPEWEPTRSQIELDSIVLQDKNKIVKFTFEELILADGYLCPGSARAYKTLQIALPMLFDNEVPVKDDIVISFGPSECAARVFMYMYDNNNNHVQESMNLKGRELTVKRISTGKMVSIEFLIPDVDGHTPEAAEVGDKILKAVDGSGFEIITNL